MSSQGPVSRPRGPLPARVYWFRRGLVLGLALLLVAGLVLLVSSFGGGGGDTAVTAAAPSSPTATPSTDPSGSPSSSSTAPTTQPTQPTTGTTKKKAALSPSQGTCETEDVLVRGAPEKVVGGSDVTIPLVLTTTSDPCTFAVSAKTVVAKITSGDDRVWTSQDCPAAIPSRSVVVRRVGEKATTVDLAWSGRRSERGCAGGQAWAQPGSYHVIAASLGGQQSDQQFSLGTPPRPVVTKTAKPKQQPSKRPRAVQTPKG